LNEEKSKHASLAELKGLPPNIFSQFAEAGERHSQNRMSARDECKKYDLIDAPWFRLVDQNDWFK
jgi:hypothetical protein